MYIFFCIYVLRMRSSSLLVTRMQQLLDLSALIKQSCSIRTLTVTDSVVYITFKKYSISLVLLNLRTIFHLYTMMYHLLTTSSAKPLILIFKLQSK